MARGKILKSTCSGSRWHNTIGCASSRPVRLPWKKGILSYLRRAVRGDIASLPVHNNASLEPVIRSLL